MIRPLKRRIIENDSNVLYFKPKGMKLRETEIIILNNDELESIYLKDYKNFDQKICAEKMGISQSTFSRILLKARKKIASILIEGKSLEINKNYKIK